MRLLFIFLLFFLNSKILEAQNPIKIADKNKIYAIGKDISVWEDKVDKINIQDILNQKLDAKFSPSQQYSPNFGMTHSVIWSKFIIENHTQEEIFLEIGNSIMDNIELYEVFEDNSFKVRKAGILQAFSDREVQTNLFLFSLKSDKLKKPQVFYLKLKNDFPLLFPLNVATLKPLLERNHPLDVFEGAYIGIVLIMALYNLFVYFSVRDRVYLWYVGYVISSGILVSNVRGYAFEFFWSNWFIINDYASNFGNLVIIFSTFFTISFLNTKKYVPKWEKVLYVFLFFSFVSIALNLAGLKLESEIVGQATATLMFISLIITGVLVYYRGFKTARYYILAWSFFLIGAIILIADLNGAFESNFFTNHAMQFGSTLEILLLSFALADRINTYKREKEDAQLRTLEAMKENERLIINQNKILEQKVEERTQQLQEANEELRTSEEEIRQQAEELRTINENLNIAQNELQLAFDEITQKNKDITASITYASRIQSALLTLDDEIQRVFPQHFILFRPRDVVSGDFYWFYEKDNKSIVIAIDCTGHGVPGAFMSMIADSLLNQIILEKEFLQADLILDEMNLSIRKALKQDITENRDGMDLALCILDKENQVLEYSGAHNPLIIIQNNQMREIKGDPFGIGGYQGRENRKFTRHIIDINPEVVGETIFYLYSDGYQDQFGGPEKKKFFPRRFRELLFANHQKPLAEQRNILNSTIINWMETEHRQIDDILVIGVKV